MFKKLSKKISTLFIGTMITTTATAAMAISCTSSVVDSTDDICNIDVILSTKWNDQSIIEKYDAKYSLIRNMNNYLIKNELTGSDSRDRVLISLSDGPFFDKNAETNWLTDNTLPGVDEEKFDPVILDQKTSNIDTYDSLDFKDVEYYSFIQMQNFILTGEMDSTDFSNEPNSKGEYPTYTEKRQKYEAKVFDYEELHEINQLNISKLDLVVRHFKSQNKKVYLVGKGYGGNLLSHYLLRYYDKIANDSSTYIDGAVIGGAKVNMDSWYLDVLKHNYDDRLIEKWSSSTDSDGNIVNKFDGFAIRSEIEDAIEKLGYQRRWRWYWTLEENYSDLQDAENESSFIMNDYVSLENYLSQRTVLWNGDQEYDGETYRIGIKDEVANAILDFENVKDDPHHPEYKERKVRAEAAEFLENLFTNSRYLNKKMNIQRMRYSLYSLSTTALWKNISFLNKGIFFVQGTKDMKIMNYTDSEFRSIRDVRINTLTLEDSNEDLMLYADTPTGIRSKLNGIGHMTRRMLNSSLSNKESNYGSWRLSINNKQLSALKVISIN